MLKHEEQVSVNIFYFGSDKKYSLCSTVSNSQPILSVIFALDSDYKSKSNACLNVENGWVLTSLGLALGGADGKTLHNWRSHGLLQIDICSRTNSQWNLSVVFALDLILFSAVGGVYSAAEYIAWPMTLFSAIRGVYLVA